jgi:hypothetical protein
MPPAKGNSSTGNIAGLINAAKIAVMAFNIADSAVTTAKDVRLKVAKEAADAMRAAVDSGATQEQIAEGVGKSQTWVSRMLSWQARGFDDGTLNGQRNRNIRPPFAESSKEARHKKYASQQKTHNLELSRPVQALTPTPGPTRPVQALTPHVPVAGEKGWGHKIHGPGAVFPESDAMEKAKFQTERLARGESYDTAECRVEMEKHDAKVASLLVGNGGGPLMLVSAEYIEAAPTHRFGAAGIPIACYGKDETIGRLQKIGSLVERELGKVHEHLAVARKLCDDEAAFDEFKRIYCPSLGKIGVAL